MATHQTPLDQPLIPNLYFYFYHPKAPNPPKNPYNRFSNSTSTSRNPVPAKF